METVDHVTLISTHKEESAIFQGITSHNNFTDRDKGLVTETSNRDHLKIGENPVIKPIETMSELRMNKLNITANEIIESNVLKQNKENVNGPRRMSQKIISKK